MPKKKNDSPEVPGGPVPALAHRAVVEPESPSTPDVHRGARTRLTAALVVGAVVIAGATATAFALTRASGGSTATMSGATATPTRSARPGPVVDTTGFPTGGIGIFTDTCRRTKTAPNDPILMPGMTGMSMQHDFFGNTGTTASSLTASLVGGSTSCTTTADSSAYWTPVLYQNGSALTPTSTLIYWRAPVGAQSSVKTIPAGLTMIAGNESALAPQGKQTIGWTCSGTAKVKLSDSPQDCESASMLRLVITFPNCWDGHTLDGAKQTNVVMMTGKTCPSSHPAQIPQIVFHANYPTPSAAGLTLSVGPSTQGPITTEHADFMNGWNEPVLTSDVNACVVTGTRCGPVSGAEATPKGGKVQ